MTYVPTLSSQRSSKWLVNWWKAFMNESVQALLPCRHLRYEASSRANFSYSHSVLSHDAVLTPQARKHSARNFTPSPSQNRT
jgi:hypothetical protein